MDRLTSEQCRYVTEAMEMDEYILQTVVFKFRNGSESPPATIKSIKWNAYGEPFIFHTDIGVFRWAEMVGFEKYEAPTRVIDALQLEEMRSWAQAGCSIQSIAKGWSMSENEVREVLDRG